MSKKERVNISLTRAEYEVLLLMCGYAVASAMQDGDENLGYAFLALTNSINRDRPNWKQYEIPAEEKV